MRRTSVQLMVAAALLVLLAVLGTLQYRWLGEVSTAERERLRSSLRARAADFTRDFDREITQTFIAFRPDVDRVDTDMAGALSDAYRKAQSESAVGGIVRTVYVVDGGGPAAPRLLQLDPEVPALAPVEWPPEFEPWRRTAGRVAQVAPGLPPLFIGDAIDARTPALLVSLPAVKRIATGDRLAIVHDPGGPARTVILRLDRDQLQRALLERLVARHFGDGEYLVSVRTRSEPPSEIYTSANDAGSITPDNAELAAGMFEVRLDDLSYFTRGAPPPPGSGSIDVKDRVAITIVRRATGERTTAPGADASGAWQVLIRGRNGSLDAVVARSRHRNLAIGLGVLGLLAASFVFLIASARRQQRLARQQMEFVAAVSHELRTPLAVIRSAGENLADGVVSDGEQVRQYGSLVRTEGRRLSETVERVMEFAGISSGAPIRTRPDLDIVRVVDEAVRSVEPDARERAVAIAVRAERALPPLVGDEAALRSAVQNVVGNAVKYSPDAATVQVAIDADAGRLRVSVTDRGLGIDSADLPHIFKPFYRGRRAVDAQIRGTGVGLSVVRHVVDAHNGEVRVESRVGEGTTVVISLPAASHREGLAGDTPQARATTRAAT